MRTYVICVQCLEYKEPSPRRTCSKKCLRLYQQKKYNSRPSYSAPKFTVLPNLTKEQRERLFQAKEYARKRREELGPMLSGA